MRKGRLDNLVFALDHASWIGTGSDVTQANIVRQRSKKRDALTDEHRESTDDQAVDEAGAQELLNRLSTVDV